MLNRLWFRLLLVTSHWAAGSLGSTWTPREAGMSCPICGILSPRTFGQLDEGYWSFDALYSIDQRKVRGSSLAPCETSLIHTPTLS